jgi:hypothetical protein
MHGATVNIKIFSLIVIPPATVHCGTHKDSTHNPGEERLLTVAHSYTNVRHLVHTAPTNQIYSSCRMNMRCALAQSEYWPGYGHDNRGTTSIRDKRNWFFSLQLYPDHHGITQPPTHQYGGLSTRRVNKLACKTAGAHLHCPLQVFMTCSRIRHSNFRFSVLSQPLTYTTTVSFCALTIIRFPAIYRI